MDKANKEDINHLTYTCHCRKYNLINIMVLQLSLSLSPSQSISNCYQPVSGVVVRDLLIFEKGSIYLTGFEREKNHSKEIIIVGKSIYLYHLYSIYLYDYLSIYMAIYLYSYLSIWISINMVFYLFLKQLFIYLTIYISLAFAFYLSIYI